MTGIAATTVRLPAGGGAYLLPELTVGVFLNDQPDHRLTVGSDRRQHVPLKRLQGWVLPAGAEGLCEYDAPLDVTIVSLPEVLLRDVGPELDPTATRPVVGELDPLLTQLVLQAEDFGRGGTLYAETMAHALAAQMTRFLQPAEPSVTAIEDLRLRRVVEYVRAHLADDLSLAVMAEVAVVSPSHFARAFKRAMGVSPLQFVISERLETSLVLLRTTRLSVAQIAYRVGYNDVARFGQHFKRRFRRTPGAARDG